MSDGTTDGDVSTEPVAAGEVDVAALFEALRDEVRRSGADPGGAVADDGRRAAREEAERLWPVSAERPLRLRKLMRWYVEPLAYDQRSFNAAALRLIDDLEERVARLETELRRTGGAEPS